MRRTGTVGVIGGLVLGGVAGLTAAASGAQAAPAERQFVRLIEVRLKPETMPQWVELQKSEAIPMEKKAGAPWRQVWTSGNEYFDRFIIEPLASFAELDGGNLAVNTVGAEAAASLHARIQPMAYGLRAVIGEVRHDLGYGTPPDRPRLAVLTIIDVTPGQAGEFEAFVKGEAVAARKKSGTPWMSVMHVLYGGDANRYYLWTPIANHAELAKGSPFERGFGADGARVVGEKTRTSVSRFERRIVRFVNDLSYINTTAAR